MSTQPNPMVSFEDLINQQGLLGGSPMAKTWQQSPMTRGLLEAMSPGGGQPPLEAFDMMAGGLNKLSSYAPTQYGDVYQTPAAETAPQTPLLGHARAYDAWQQSQDPGMEGWSIPAGRMSFGDWTTRQPQRDIMQERLMSLGLFG